MSAELLFAGSTGLTTAAALNAGQQQTAMARYNAAVAEAQARAQRQRAALEESRHRRTLRALLSAQRTAAAASGVLLEGSPLEAMGDSAAEGELDALLIRYGGEIAARQSESTAALERYKGKVARTNSYLTAGASLLNGVNRLGLLTV